MHDNLDTDNVLMKKSKVKEGLYTSNIKDNFDSIYKKNRNLYDERKKFSNYEKK